MLSSDAVNPYTLSVDGLDAGYFSVRSLKGREAISRAYSFRLVVSADAMGVDVERLALGRRAALSWDVGNGVRAFYGVIAAIEVGAIRNAERIEYRMHFVPRLWLLKRKRRTRIFQNMRVPEVVSSVLLEEGIGARWQLTRSYPVRDYCTQYEETDYQFVTRLLAEAGIFFYFPQGGLVDGALKTMSTIVGAVGNVGSAAASALAGAAAGSVVSTVASAASPLLPGDTLIGGDDAAVYPPIGPDDPSALEALQAATLFPDVSGTASANIGGVSVSATVSASDAAAMAGSIVAAFSSRAAPALHFLEMLESPVSHADKITRFHLGTSVRPTASTFRDYDPDRPLTKLESQALSVAPFPESALETLAAAATAAGSAVGSAIPGAAGAVGSQVAANAGVAAAVLQGVLGDPAPPYLEVYDHHGPYLFPRWTLPSDEAPRMLRQARRRASMASGDSGCPDLGPGHKFALMGHPIGRLDLPYVATVVEHRGQANPDGTEGGRYAVYENSFECAPASMPFVPPKPKRRSVQVSLTAVVVGPEGVEIHVDRMGQIKVQFHWDRAGKYDDRSSCWIRTMHPWGGAGWGAQFIPRVGMEVVVVFEGGDPDKPMVLGSLYNATHPSPFPLPVDKTRSGWRTQSSPGGLGFNELSFEDAANEEQVYLRAQKNFDEVVQNNHTLRVENDELIRIIGNRIDTIEKNLEQHVKGDHVSTVDGNRMDIVTSNSDRRVRGTLTTRVEGRERRDVEGLADLVYADDLTVRVLGCATTIVGKNDKKRSWTTHAEGTAALSGLDRLELSSETEIVMSVGDSSIRMTKDRIELSSSAIVTSGEGGKLSVSKDGVALKSSDTQVTMNAKLVMKSQSASVVLDKEMKLDGTKILLNSPAIATDEPPKEPEPPTKVELSDQDGEAVAFQRFVAKLDAGTDVGGRTDKDGKAELEIESGGKIVFPDLTMTDEPAQGDLQPHVLRQGEYLARLAFIHGFDADKAWNDGKNAALKELRKNPNILHPGDIVHFPRGPRVGALLKKGSTNQYTVSVPKTTVRLKLDDKRLFGARYVVEGLGKRPEASTDASGNLTVEVPVHMREIRLVFPDKHITCTVRIGDLDPIDETTGARKRLEHLGYRKPSVESSESEADAVAADRIAIAAFQRAEGLDATGELDAATKAALVKAHGS